VIHRYYRINLSNFISRTSMRLSYALNGAKDNPEMESFNGHFKQEGKSLFLDACDIEDLRMVVAKQMKYYNTKRRHSSLGYIPPMMYVERMLRLWSRWMIYITAEEAD
jgi:transposase InsO family protein